MKHYMTSKKITSLMLLVLTMFGVINESNAQQDSQYTLYMYNTASVNPAYVGSRDKISVFLLHRSQWVGLDGAPVTNNFTINAPIHHSNFGWGVSFINDKLGPTSESEISADLAYFIQVSDDFRLSLGLKGTANLFKLDVNKLDVYNSLDPKFQNMGTDFSPNVGAGLYLFSEQTYLGLSVPNLFQNYHYNDNNIQINREKMHFYLIGGHVFKLGKNLKFKPAFLAKAVEGAPLQIDLTGNILIYNKFTLGASYRWDASISSLAGFQISKSWFIGYGYDIETSELANYSSGSHEIFIRFEFINKNRTFDPRFF